MSKYPPWLHTFTGIAYDIEHPTADMIHPDDIAHALSNLCRFTGHANPYYSVAQHCCFVAAMVEPQHKRWALLHDAAEAYVGDVAEPLKRCGKLGEEHRRLEDLARDAILERFGLEVTEEAEAAVREADLRMLMTEAEVLLPQPPPRDWSIPFEPYDELPLAIIPTWPPHFAEKLYRDQLSKCFVLAEDWVA